MFRRTSGWTLIELLVASVLGVLLLGMTVSFLIPSMRYSGEGAARAEVQQQAIMALNAMEADLRTTSVSGLTISYGNQTAPPGFAVQPVEDVTQRGAQVWKLGLYVSYWDKTEGRLVRETWPPTPPGSLQTTLVNTEPNRITDPDFLGLVSNKNGSERYLASGVTNFTVRHAGISTTAITPPITLNVTLERKPGSNQPVVCQLMRTVTMRNDL